MARKKKPKTTVPEELCPELDQLSQKQRREFDRTELWIDEDT